MSCFHDFVTLPIAAVIFGKEITTLFFQTGLNFQAVLVLNLPLLKFSGTLEFFLLALYTQRLAFFI